MHLGAIAQIQGLKAARFLPAHETANNCYCRLCFLDFMVRDAERDVRRGADGRLMYWLCRVAEEP